jgi:hypothetical protein
MTVEMPAFRSHPPGVHLLMTMLTPKSASLLTLEAIGRLPLRFQNGNPGVIVFMAQTPGAIQERYRQLIPALVQQAIVD